MYIPNKEEILEFVRQSNAIENIFEDGSHPLVRDHISAIEYAITTFRKGNLPIYLDVHRILLASEPEKTPGVYRKILVRVGNYVAPPPELVKKLMTNHWDTVLGGPRQKDVEQWIWNMHCEFESIHPFIDGNGRVGRIDMNALRLWHGLPWITIRADERRGYYQRITNYRTQRKNG